MREAGRGPPILRLYDNRLSGNGFKPRLQIPLLFPYGLALHMLPLREAAGRDGPR